MAIQRDFVLNRGLVVNTEATIAGVNVLANDYATYTTLTANIYNTYAVLLANISSGTNTSLVYANDYATYQAALANDYNSYVTVQGEYRANDYATLLAAQSNDYNSYTTLQGEYRANDYNSYTTLQGEYRANDYATLLAAQSNDYNSYTTVQGEYRANDYATLLAAQSNDYNSYTTVQGEYRANDYNSYTTVQGEYRANDYATLLAARANDYNSYTTLANEYQANDFSTYTTLQSEYRANDYATWSGLNSAINIKANSSVNVVAGDGITGGGPLTGNVTVAVDATVVRTAGDQTISGQKTFSDSIIVEGDLTVNGNVVSVESTSLRVTDRFIELASNTVGAPAGDVGIYLNRGNSGNSAFFYDESAGYFALAHTADPATNSVVSPTSFGALRIDTLLVSNTSVVTNLNADLLDGQTGSYYVDFNNATNTNLITLARVTANGASTTDAITVGGLTVDSNTLHVDSTNNFVGIRTVTPNAPLQVEEAGLDTSLLVTSATTADQVLDSFSATTFRTAKYLVQVHDTVNNWYQASEILLTHDGVNTYSTEYAIVYTNSSLASFNSSISGGSVRLLVTPVNAVNTIKVYRSGING
jgi:hypothetical protein